MNSFSQGNGSNMKKEHHLILMIICPILTRLTRTELGTKGIYYTVAEKKKGLGLKDTRSRGGGRKQRGAEQKEEEEWGTEGEHKGKIGTQSIKGREKVHRDRTPKKMERKRNWCRCDGITKEVVGPLWSHIATWCSDQMTN